MSLLFFSPGRLNAELDLAFSPAEEAESPESERNAGLMPATPSRIMERELSGEGVGVRAVNDRRAYLVEGNDDDDEEREAGR